MIYEIGIDDHDSPELGCTTHFTTNLIKTLLKNNIKIVDFPYLIRLNPNIPWKTRGNAAVKIIIETNRERSEIADIVWNESIEYVNKVSKALKYNRKPGLAIAEGVKNNDLFYFYIKAVTDVIPLDLAIKIANKLDIRIKGDRGIIGSLAAIGFEGKITYELLTYRFRENWQKERKINIASLERFDSKYFPYVFGNLDYVRKRPLILSHGSDPVFYGIRGTDPKLLLNGLKEIEIEGEEVENFMIFKTNQGTDSHLITTRNRIYQNISKTLIVDTIEIRKGGDVIITSTDNTVIFIYRETGELNKAARELIKGDKITVIGAIKPSSKYGKIIDAERIVVNELANLFELRNPRCPVCNGTSESLGKNKGYRCKKCGYRFHGEKIVIEKERKITLGIYQSRYYRHLTKPIFIIPKENSQNKDVLEFVLKNIK